MQVKRDFDEVYAAEEDPWGIGEADSERYTLYRDLLLEHAHNRGSILDIGSGFGAFLARFEGEFESLHAVELSGEAVTRGAQRFPFIDFAQGSAEALERTPADGRKFDAVIYSDVIMYFDEAGKERSLRWIDEHLADGGLAFVAAYAPGGDYLDVPEFRRLVRKFFAVERELVLESEHAVFLCRRKRRMVALTLDYETWQPIPEGRSIDWERDVFAPTAELLDVLDGLGAPLTIFAEMGEWIWLRENEPALAGRWEEQLRDALRRGHDVQMHLHPDWLPELGARREGGQWQWDRSLAKAADYPGDLTELIARCKALLEETLRPVDPEYAVTCFRAGAYEAQPFDRLYDALAANGIGCDSSVLPGGSHPERGYDYRLAYSQHQPWFASRYDPQLKAPPAERAIVEIPVFAPEPGKRWTFDSDECTRFHGRLTEWEERPRPTSEQLRLRKAFGRRLGNGYARFKRFRPLVNRVLPRRLAWYMTGYEPEPLVEHDYFVLVGHSKADLVPDEIEVGVSWLREGFELVTLSEMARVAREELERSVTPDPEQEARRQVEREYGPVMGSERNEAPSFRLQALIPRDRSRVLDYGCGAGTWSERIAGLYPWMRVTGIDVGEDFIAKANAEHASERVDFRIADFTATGFDDGEFDCVYADNSLEHAWDVDATLREVHRVLRDGGVLVAALPPDARNPARVCDNHTWKTAPHDVRMRLEAAGFTDIAIEEVDIFGRLGMSPFPPSLDLMLYVTAWKREQPAGPWTRAEEIATWAYRALDPETPSHAEDPWQVLAEGHAWCAGYNLVTGTLLDEAGYEVTWVSMLAEDHPRGRGERSTDSHEVLEVRPPSGGGGTRVLDPMANVWFDCSLDDLLADPSRADTPREEDERYRSRGYELYSTAFFYERVKQVARRPAPRGEPEFRPVRAG